MAETKWKEMMNTKKCEDSTWEEIKESEEIWKKEKSKCEKCKPAMEKFHPDCFYASIKQRGEEFDIIVCSCAHESCLSTEEPEYGSAAYGGPWIKSICDVCFIDKLLNQEKHLFNDTYFTTKNWRICEGSYVGAKGEKIINDMIKVTENMIDECRCLLFDDNEDIICETKTETTIRMRKEFTEGMSKFNKP